LHHDNAPFHISIFTREFFTKNNMTVVPHPSFFSLFLRLKTRPQLAPLCYYHHFYTTEAIEAESRAVLNTLTENDSQDAFKNGGIAGNGVYERKGLLGML
jgi:hypothetical protein